MLGILQRELAEVVGWRLQRSTFNWSAQEGEELVLEFSPVLTIHGDRNRTLTVKPESGLFGLFVLAAKWE